MASNQMAVIGEQIMLDKPKLQELLPKAVDADRFARVAVLAIQRTPDLLNKDRNSLFLAVRSCASMGLMPDGKEAALVAFGNAVVSMPMVGGLIKIAAKHGYVMASGVIYENDDFFYELGIDPVMHHRPPKLGQDRGKLLGAWAQARHESGQVYLDVMDVADMEKVRSVSRAKNGDLWTKWVTEAYRKSVTRRLFKNLPKKDVDEHDERVIDPRFDPEFAAEEPVVAPEKDTQAATATGGRPRALQAVLNRAKPEPTEEVVDVETGEVLDASFTEAQPEPQPAPPESADDIF